MQGPLAALPVAARVDRVAAIVLLEQQERLFEDRVVLAVAVHQEQGPPLAALFVIQPDAVELYEHGKDSFLFSCTCKNDRSREVQYTTFGGNIHTIYKIPAKTEQKSRLSTQVCTAGKREKNERREKNKKRLDI